MESVKGIEFHADTRFRIYDIAAFMKHLFADPREGKARRRQECYQRRRNSMTLAPNQILADASIPCRTRQC